MIDLEKYNNGNDTYTSPRNDKTYKSLKAFRSHWNYKGHVGSDTFQKRLKNIACKHCNVSFIQSVVKRHETACYLNPVNLRLCAVCDGPIKDYKYSKGTCSCGCSNVHFASKRKPDDQCNYVTICFRHHEKKCIVCGEDKIVAVHHNDCDHDNNDPANLIPLCPTHHVYVHSRYKDEVQPIIDRYVKQRTTGV